ncbi:MAG: stage 0 sporulation protein [Chlamydiae bacterium]|nr:stage 0 sporulation protein [Chlamydiota bacterium]MBI3265908.1 stage 0 sporulation protein [Chlamydiota bacterium]
MSYSFQVRMRDFGRLEEVENSLGAVQHGELFILRTQYGLDYGKGVSLSRKEASQDHEYHPRPVMVRQATPSDMEKIEQNRRDLKSSLQICRDQVYAHHLPMKVLTGEYSLERQKMVFYFTSPGRVDFRELVRALAASFKTRIELYQLGPRDGAKVVGGIAPCGKTQLCCTQFMRSFEAITTRMAKVQRLPVRQEKLLGLCGQLKCCLKFELDAYAAFSKDLPKEGAKVSTQFGKGYILVQNILKKSVTVRLEDDREVHVSVDELTVLR